VLTHKRIVFDVTQAEFYSKTGRYHVFAGKDFTVNLLGPSMDEATLNSFTLDPSTTESKLKEKVEFYKNKYPRVGWLKEWRDVHGNATYV
jgi:hypothetical protein